MENHQFFDFLLFGDFIDLLIFFLNFLFFGILLLYTYVLFSYILMFFDFFIFFEFFFFSFGQVKGNAEDGRSRHRPTKVFEFAKIVLRPKRSQLLGASCN